MNICTNQNLICCSIQLLLPVSVRGKIFFAAFLHNGEFEEYFEGTKTLLILIFPLHTMQIIRGDSLRKVPFSHGAYLRYNGARERSIIQLTDLLSHWLSLRIITGTDSSRNSSWIWNLYCIFLFLNIWITGVENNTRAQWHLPFCICWVQSNTVVQYNHRVQLWSYLWTIFTLQTSFAWGGGGRWGTYELLYCSPLL